MNRRFQNCCHACVLLALLSFVAVPTTVWGLTPTYSSVTTSVTDMSPSGVNVGTLGYWIAAVDRVPASNNGAPDEDAVDALPGYVTLSFAPEIDSAGGYSGFKDVVLPNGTLSKIGDLEALSGNPVKPVDIMTLTFGAGVPTSLSLGLISDNSDSNNFQNVELHVNGVSVPTLPANAGTATDSTDIYNFLLSDITPGDSVTIAGTAAFTNFLSHFGGVTLDPGNDNLVFMRVDRLTGAMSLENNTGTDVDIVGYQLSSEYGALTRTGWMSITGNHDEGSGAANPIDADDAWTILSDPDSHTDLSEAQFGGTPGDGGTLALGASYDMGTAWIQTSVEDLEMTLLLANGDQVIVPVVFDGNGEQNLTLGDLDASGGPLTGADWTLFKAGAYTNLDGLSPAEAYKFGDLNGDGLANTVDFKLFKTQYELDNGPGSFAAMISGNQVPEPATYLLLMAAGAVFGLPKLGRSLRQRPAVGTFLATFVAVVAWVSSSLAVTVAYDSAQLNTNNLSPSGIDVGSEGYWFAAVNRSPPNNNSPTDTDAVDALPSYAAISFGAGTDSSGGWTAYKFVTLPNGVNVRTGVIEAVEQSPNVPHEFLSLTFSAGVPSDLVLGLMHDNSDFTGFSSTELYVNGVSTGTLTNNSSVSDAPTADLHSFILSDISPGDTVVIEGLPVAGGTSVNHFGGITLDPVVVPELILEVNTTNGSVKIMNADLGPFVIDSYTIESPGGALNEAGWDSIEENGQAGLPQGDGSGNGWEKIAGDPGKALGEYYLTGSSDLSAISSIELGQLFDPGTFGVGVDGDLVFTFSNSEGFVIDGIVNYVTSAGLTGDFNSDGTVDAADYVVWRNNLGGDESTLNGNGDGSGTVDVGDYTEWKANFGASLGGGNLTSAPSNVPEPSSVGLVVLASLAGMLACRRRV